jgi:hypothetical protein
MGNSSNGILSHGSNLLLWDIQGYVETENLSFIPAADRVKYMYDKHYECTFCSRAIWEKMVKKTNSFIMFVSPSVRLYVRM